MGVANPSEGQVTILAGEIQALLSDFAALIARLKPILDSHPDQNKAEQSGEFWRAVFFYDALVRVRLLVETNFHFIETLGLLSVTRYIFELAVWMKTLAGDSQYGLVYHAQLCNRMWRYWKDYCEQVVREIQLLRTLEAQEKQLSQTKIRAGESPNEARRAAATEIDRRAARNFSLYGEQALINGYGFQAHLVEKKVLPSLQQTVAEVGEEFRKALARVPDDLRRKVIDWQWKTQAVSVDMGNQYEFIYTYCSRLLHATPASITTNQKNLEVDEMVILLRFVRVCLRDFIELAELQCVLRSAH